MHYMITNNQRAIVKFDWEILTRVRLQLNRLFNYSAAELVAPCTTGQLD